ncbi:UNVERIFIED_CONTAM: hypothetical protein Slati_2782400 [Sesamum latifolium]|uniref:Uncharacterized protein n=1 Tax=Sesamum latifolium TaxID=2727402 RepID=A0AAW2VZR8_9LAMI
MDLDLALKENFLPALTDKSTSKEKREKEMWEKSNCMCLMIMKKTIPEAFSGTMCETLTKAKDFLDDIEKREYIMEMSHLASKSRALKLDISKDLLVHLILISLPAQFSQFKVSYNCQKETWSLNELISHCVQEEERIK